MGEKKKRGIMIIDGNITNSNIFRSSFSEKLTCFICSSINETTNSNTHNIINEIEENFATNTRTKLSMIDSSTHHNINGHTYLKKIDTLSNLNDIELKHAIINYELPYYLYKTKKKAHINYNKYDLS